MISHNLNCIFKSPTDDNDDVCHLRILSTTKQSALYSIHSHQQLINQPYNNKSLIPVVVEMVDLQCYLVTSDIDHSECIS